MPVVVEPLFVSCNHEDPADFARQRRTAFYMELKLIDGVAASLFPLFLRTIVPGCLFLDHRFHRLAFPAFASRDVYVSTRYTQ